MLRDDKITSLAAHDKFLVIGTHQGYIYAMSHEGTMDHAHIPVGIQTVILSTFSFLYSYIQVLKPQRFHG